MIFATKKKHSIQSYTGQTNLSNPIFSIFNERGLGWSWAECKKDSRASHCVPVTFLRSRGKFMSGDTFQGGAFFSSEGRFFFFRGALFFLQRGSFWSVEYAEKKSGGHRPPWKKKCDQKPPLKISSQWFLLICHTSLCLHRSLFSLNSI